MKIDKDKIVHLTSVHSRSDIRVFHKECKTLAAQGYDVVLIVPDARNAVVDGVKICAVPKPNNRRERMMRTTREILKAALKENASIYHFHDPELIPVGIVLKILGKRVVYDAHENISEDILNKTYLSRRLRRLVAWLAGSVERIGSVFFDFIIAATPAIAMRFPASKTVLVQNFPLSRELASDLFVLNSNRRAMVYVGTINDIRGVKEMIEAIDLLPKTVESKLLLAGSFDSPEIEQEIRQMSGWQSTDFMGWQSREQLAQLFSQARAGLVLFHPVPNHMEAQPNKLFEYMSAGIPVIASNFPLWRKIIEEASCGILVDPLNPRAIAEAMRWLLEHPEDAEAMGERGRQAVCAKFNWESEKEKLLRLYTTLTHTNSPVIQDSAGAI